jgi:hypothetical protein
MILARIKRGEKKLAGDLTDLFLVTVAKRFPESEPAYKSAQVIFDRRESQEKILMSKYEKIEANIDQVDGQQLYDLIRALKRRTRLEKIFKSIPQHEPITYA